MDIANNIPILIVPGILILLGLVTFLTEPAYIRRRSVIPLLALVVASGVFVIAATQVRAMASLQEKLKLISKVAFFLTVALIVDTLRYGDFQEAIKAALMFVVGIMIGSTESIVWVGLGGLISGGIGLWEILNPPERVRNRTVGYLPEASWHLAKILLMLLVVIADLGALGALVESV